MKASLTMSNSSRVKDNECIFSFYAAKASFSCILLDFLVEEVLAAVSVFFFAFLVFLAFDAASPALDQQMYQIPSHHLKKIVHQ
jgi:hypothetical protein